MICWTLGITEHHNGVDNVSSLINLALLTGHVGRYGSGLNPLRGQNNVQGGGDMGALPDRFPGFQHVEVEANRLKFEKAWNTQIPPKRGWNLTGMLEAMGRKELTALMILGENPLQSEADRLHTEGLLRKLEFLVVQDLVLTPTAELAHVVLPAATGWCESDGTVTNSERRIQRVRKAINPPGEARDDAEILHDLARVMGHDWGAFNSKQTWDELRTLSPVHAGISYERLEQGAGLQWPCYDEAHPGEMFLHSRLWEQPLNGPKVAFQTVRHSPPVEPLTPEFPLRLTTGRRLSDYNTGVQTGGFDSPLRRGETLDLSPEDAAHLGVTDGETVRVVSPRGSIEAPVRLSNGLRPGLVFMTFHFQDKVNTNILTIDATDPRSGTAEFKACSIRVEKLALAHQG
jgi:formate dehydrogenase major subunit